MAILSTIATALSAIAAIGAVVVAWQVHKGQQNLARGQAILPLWDYLANLEKIHYDDVVVLDVVDVANTLELVALCYETEVVHQHVIKRAFRDQYMQHYEDILAITEPIAGYNLNGEQFLEKHNHAAVLLYEKLRAEKIRRDMQ